MSAPPSLSTPRSSRPSASADALLSGLSRLRSNTPPPPSSSLPPTTPPPVYTPPPPFSSVRAPHIDRSLAVPRADWLTTVELATGAGGARPPPNDAVYSAAVKLSRWVRAMRLDPAQIVRGLVVGKGRGAELMNARVCGLVVWMAWLLGDEWRVAMVKKGSKIASIEGDLGVYVKGKVTLWEKWGREIEGNWSLDRMVRRMRLENSVDERREPVNMDRYAEVMSAGEHIRTVGETGVSAAESIVRMSIGSDVKAIIVADVANCWALGEYLRMKSGNKRADEGEMLRKRLYHVINGIGSREGRMIRKMLDLRVWKAAMGEAPPVRPESKNRRDVPCEFSTFDALHRALGKDIGPPMQPEERAQRGESAGGRDYYRGGYSG